MGAEGGMMFVAGVSSCVDIASELSFSSSSVLQESSASSIGMSCPSSNQMSSSDSESEYCHISRSTSSSSSLNS